MRIGIDLRFTAATNMGTGTYAETLVLDLLQALEPGDKIFGFTPDCQLPAALKDRVMLVQIPAHRFRADTPLAERLLWDTSIAQTKLDIYFAPTGLAPLAKTCPVAITVHDLLFEQQPASFSPALLQYLKRELSRSVAGADLILAISEHTASELEKIYHVNRSRMKVLHQGLRPIFRDLPSEIMVERTLQRLKVPRPYILALSNHAPHKNTPFAMDVFTAWIKRSGSKRHTLVLAGGGPAPNRPLDLKAELIQRGIEQRSRILGRVEDPDLLSLYAGAEAFLFPSQYEGWGLPPLEAIALGTPALVSDRGALPEALGDAGYVLPLSRLDAWLQSLDEILEHSPPPQLIKHMQARRAELLRPRGDALRKALSEAIAICIRDHPTRKQTPLAQPQPKPSILYMADWHSPSGFGQAARLQAHALCQQGMDVLRYEVKRDRLQLEGLQVPGRLPGTDELLPDVVIQHGSPDSIVPFEGKYNIGIFVWETDRIPCDDSRGAAFNWKNQLLKLDEIWVPSAFTKDVLHTCAVQRPCFVYPHPVDSQFYCPGPRRMPSNILPAGFDATWTVFLFVGTWDIRKRPDDLVRAFAQEFSVNDRAVLILKTSRTEDASKLRSILNDPCNKQPNKAPVIGIAEHYSPDQLRELYRCAHGFVTATRGEGFGYCALEAMSCGVPIVATQFSAMRDYVSDLTGYPVPHHLEAVPNETIFPWFRRDQHWGVPDLDALGKAMRRIHQSRKEARGKGLHAREWVVTHCTADKIGRNMRERLEQIFADATA